MSVALAIYGAGLFLTFLYALGMMLDPTWWGIQKGARLLFLSPVWPALLVIVTIRGIKHAWKTADWGNK